eukprot:jgi/Tetstr1/466696/TSEL_001010.t1
MKWRFASDEEDSLNEEESDDHLRHILAPVLEAAIEQAFEICLRVPHLGHILHGKDTVNFEPIKAKWREMKRMMLRTLKLDGYSHINLNATASIKSMRALTFSNFMDMFHPAYGSDPGDFYMKVIAKKFRGVWHYGVITGVVTEWVLEDYGGATQWRAVFEDGEIVGLLRSEVVEAMAAAQEHPPVDADGEARLVTVHEGDDLSRSGKVTVQSGWVMEDCLHHMETCSILNAGPLLEEARVKAIMTEKELRVPRRWTRSLGRGGLDTQHGAKARRQGQRGAKARRPGQRGAKARRPGQRGAKARRPGQRGAKARRPGQRGAKARRPGQRGAKARRPGQRGAKARRPGQRGAKARRPGQRGAKARRPGQRGAKARRPGQRGAKARRPGQRGANASGMGGAAVATE